ncbi:hypothetical protein T492DRAFT_856384 [Pavlovales sp. CCMP2436]|nr:hypothetical protein T492DRAFT_856384 [Pavlovales sp. CCMP2436]
MAGGEGPLGEAAEDMEEAGDRGAGVVLRGEAEDALLNGVKDDGIAWALPSELGLPLVDACGPLAPVQGALGDCWLVGALAALGVGTALGALTETPRSDEEGLRVLYADGTPASAVTDADVTVRLYSRGAWREVTVGPRLPCTRARRLAFARGAGPSADGGLETYELWPAYVEKALATLRGGGYGSLQGGSCAVGLLAVSGGVCERIRLRPPASVRERATAASGANLEQGAAAAERAEGEYFRQSCARVWARLGAETAASAPASGQTPANFRPAARAAACCFTLERAGAASGAVDRGSGLLLNHTYACLRGAQLGRGARLLQLADPRGGGGDGGAAAGGGGVGWSGAWSAGSEEWKSAEGVALRRALLAAGADFAYPGSFWLPIEEAASLCVLPPATGMGEMGLRSAGAQPAGGARRGSRARPTSAPLARAPAAAGGWHRVELLGHWAARCVVGSSGGGMRAPVCEWPQWWLTLAPGGSSSAGADAGGEVLISLLPLPPSPRGVSRGGSTADSQGGGGGLASLTIARAGGAAVGARARAGGAARRSRKWSLRAADTIAEAGPAAPGEPATPGEELFG